MIRAVHPGSGSRIRILIFYPSRIPDPGIKKPPDPGSATQGSGCGFSLNPDPDTGFYVQNLKKKLQLGHDPDSRKLLNTYAFQFGTVSQTLPTA
jgi:hypothetical protein